MEYDKPLSNFGFNFNLRRYTPGYPKLTALNGSALLLEVSLDEPGAVVFALRPGTAAAPEMNRSAAGAYTRPLFGST
jgi:hypothetical protein